MEKGWEGENDIYGIAQAFRSVSERKEGLLRFETPLTIAKRGKKGC